MNGVIYVSDSKNLKISGNNKIDATYASITATCSKSCPFQSDNTCYAKTSFVGMIVNKLDKKAKNSSAIELARAEAKAIDDAYNGGKIPSGRGLRIHVSGDSRTITGTKLINSAVGRWRKRGGGDCWSYTHSWTNVPRKEWSNVSILASVESTSQIKAARKNGYAPAIVVAEHISDKVYTLPGSTTKFIPCVAQTRNVSCADCKLCFDSNRLFKNNMGIAFAAHGINKNSLKKRLNVIKA